MRYPEVKTVISQHGRPDDGTDSTGFFNAEFFVLHVESGLELPENSRRTLEANIQFAENVGARVVRLKGNSVPAVTAEYVTRNRITQVIFGRSAVRGWKKYAYYLALQRFMNDATHVDVHLVTQQPK